MLFKLSDHLGLHALGVDAIAAKQLSRLLGVQVYIANYCSLL